MARDQSKPLPDFRVIGAPGLKRSGGFLTEEWHPKLQGLQGVRVYTEMSQNDAVIGSILHAVDMLIRQAEWTAEPADESREAKRYAQFMLSVMDDMSYTWQDFISEVLSMLPFGWSYFEQIYKRRVGPYEGDSRLRSRFSDGAVGWRKLEIRAQDTLDEWVFDDENGLKGMWQSPPEGGLRVLVPIEKALLFRTKSVKHSPEAVSVLRTAYRSWYILKRIQEIEAIGIERDLAGIPLITVPLELFDANNEAKLDNFKTLGSEIRRDERELVIMPAEKDEQDNPTGYSIKLMNSPGQRQFDSDRIINRYESRIAMTVLADFIFLGHEQHGSFSLTSSKTHLFAVAIGGWLKAIAAVINRYGIPRLWYYNKFPYELMPRLRPGEVESPPLDELGNFLGNAIRSSAITPGPALERDVRRKANLPEEDEEFRQDFGRQPPPPTPAAVSEGEPEPEAQTKRAEVKKAAVATAAEILRHLRRG